MGKIGASAGVQDLWHLRARVRELERWYLYLGLASGWYVWWLAKSPVSNTPKKKERNPLERVGMTRGRDMTNVTETTTTAG